LTGPDLTGLESGSQTLSVTIPNLSAFVELYGISCTGSSGLVSPISGALGTGFAQFETSSLGYRGHTSSIVGGAGSGSGGSSALGSVRYLVRVNSTPSYTGPTAVSLVVSMQFDVSGSMSIGGTSPEIGSRTDNSTLCQAEV
jgi:hypothetical protein